VRDHTVRNAAAVTVAVGSLLTAPLLAATAAKNLRDQQVPQPVKTRTIVVHSPVVSLVTLPPSSRSDGNSHGHGHHGKGHGHHPNGGGGD
jgi:hypothetical protein